MKKIILAIIVGFLLASSLALADRITKPPRITTINDASLAVINNYFEDIWHMLSGYYSEFQEAVTLSGNAKVTKYSWIPAGAVRAVGAAPATEALNAANFIILEFADAADDYAQANIKVPDDMDMTQPSYICVGWSVPVTSSNMTWGYGYLITAPGEDTEGTPITGTAVVTSSSVADGLVLSPIVTLAANTITSSDVCIHIYIYRDVSEEAYGANVDVHGMAFKYTADKLGE